MTYTAEQMKLYRAANPEKYAEHLARSREYYRKRRINDPEFRARDNARRLALYYEKKNRQPQNLDAFVRVK